MGVDPAAQMANLYLYHYEAAFMETLSKQDYSKAKKFNNTSCFIDDLGMLNNDGIFVKEREKIYPAELVLNVENQDDNHATFLDIEVDVEGNQFKTKICDKRDRSIFLIIFEYCDISFKFHLHQGILITLLTSVSGVMTHDIQNITQKSKLPCSIYSLSLAPILPTWVQCFYTPVWKTDVLCRGNVRPSVCPSVRPSGFSGLFFNMLWDINLKLGIYIQ